MRHGQSSHKSTVVRRPADIGSAIADSRRALDMSQQEFAEWLSADRSYVSRLENGESVKKLDRMLAAMEALGLELVVRRKGSA